MTTPVLGPKGSATAGSTPRVAGAMALGAIAVLIVLNRGFKGISVNASVR